MAHIQFSVSGTSLHALQFSASARGNAFVANDPSVLFDEESGINPMEYLLGGYAGYINLIFYSLAHRCGITIRRLSLKMEGEIHIDRLVFNELPGIGSFSSITVLVHLETNTDRPEEFRLIRDVAGSGVITDKDGNLPHVVFRFAHEELLN